MEKQSTFATVCPMPLQLHLDYYNLCVHIWKTQMEKQFAIPFENCLDYPSIFMFFIQTNLHCIQATHLHFNSSNPWHCHSGKLYLNIGDHMVFVHNNVDI